jgi:transposase InsO family protein
MRVRFRFIHAERANYPLWLLCFVLCVSRQGYYSWLSRGQKVTDYTELDEAIKAVHKDNRRRYGTRRQVMALANKGFNVSRRTVRKRMIANGLKVRYPKAFRVTTKSDPKATFAPNYLDRDFQQPHPNRAWVGDISYIKTSSGFLYLAVVIDLYSRMVVGWSVQPHMRAELVGDALKMALGRRKAAPGLIFHSDRGSQYTSTVFRKTCERAGIVQSMSKKGDCWDNAVSESFFATIDRELLSDGRSWSPGRSSLEIFTYIETYYNRTRLHSTLGYLSPSDFEMEALQHPELSAAA